MSNDLLEVAVLRSGIGWRVMTRDWKGGAYRFRIDAEEAALRLADEVRRRGRAVKVLVQDPQGQLRPLDLPEPAPDRTRVAADR